MSLLKWYCKDIIPKFVELSKVFDEEVRGEFVEMMGKFYWDFIQDGYKKGKWFKNDKFTNAEKIKCKNAIIVSFASATIDIGKELKK